MLPDEGGLYLAFSRTKVSYEIFLDNNKNWKPGSVNQIVQPYDINVTIYEEGTYWQDVCSRLFIAMFEAWEKSIEKGISGRGGKVFSLFRCSSDDGSIETMQRGPFILVMGEEKYGFQISPNTEDCGLKTWKVNPTYVGNIVERFVKNTPTMFPKFVPLEGFKLKSNPDEFALKLLSDYEGYDSIDSTNIKISKSIETSNNLLVHFCAPKTARSFELPVDVMKMIHSELKVMTCSPEKFMTVFQRRMYEARILKLEDFLS
jgi:hypothetical protein